MLDQPYFRDFATALAFAGCPLQFQAAAGGRFGRDGEFLDRWLSGLDFIADQIAAICCQAHAPASAAGVGGTHRITGLRVEVFVGQAQGGAI